MLHPGLGELERRGVVEVKGIIAVFLCKYGQ
jgi:hypothetical protein